MTAQLRPIWPPYRPGQEQAPPVRLVPDPPALPTPITRCDGCHKPHDTTDHIYCPACIAFMATPQDAPESPEAHDNATQDVGVTRTSDTPHVAAWCAARHLPAYVVGRWVWIQWSERPDNDTLAMVKAAGFRWVNARKAWAHSCGHWSRKGQMDPRIKYGMTPVGDLDD